MEQVELDLTHILENIDSNSFGSPLITTNLKPRLPMAYVSPVFATAEQVDRICSNLRARNITHSTRFEVGGYKFMMTLILAHQTLYFWLLD